MEMFLTKKNKVERETHTNGTKSAMLDKDREKAEQLKCCIKEKDMSNKISNVNSSSREVGSRGKSK